MLLLPAALAFASARPHLVQLVIDDFGSSDHSVHDTESQISTPTLRKLADAGVRLSNYYVQPVCSPTRSALLTGRFPFRDGMQHERTILPSSTAHVPLSTKTTAELLTAHGYEAHAIGKWHLGYASWRYTPLGRGFRSFTGYLQGMVDYFNKTIGLPGGEQGLDFWRGNATDPIAPRLSAYRAAVGTYSLEQYSAAFHEVLNGYVARQAAGRAAGGRAAAALYVYLSMQTVHIPLEARTSQVDGRCTARISDHWRRVYCSMVVEMDGMIGELLASLGHAGLYDNTLLLVTTDNGGMVRPSPRPTLSHSRVQLCLRRATRRQFTSQARIYYPGPSP